MVLGLLDRVRSHAEREPARPALAFQSFHHDTDGRRLSYADLAGDAERMGRALAARLAVGDRALLLMSAVPEFAVAFLGCLAAGVVAVPVPPPMDETSLRRMVGVAEDCGISLIVSVRPIHDLTVADPRLSRWCSRYRWLLADEPDALAAPAGPRGLPAVDPADIAFLQYTSGSTRTPRGVRVTHGGLLANERAIRDAFAVTPHSTIVSWLPLHHDMGLIGGLLQPLYTGGRGVILDPATFVRRPLTWLETIDRERADISGGPNFAYDLCVRKTTPEERARLDLGTWRVAFNGAAPVFPRTLREFSAAFRPSGFRSTAHTPCYGLAEATLLVASVPVGSACTVGAFAADSLEAGRPRAAAGGRELVAYPLPPHADVRIADRAADRELGDCAVGEVVVAGPSNGTGYWGEPPAGSAAFGLRLPGRDHGPYLRTGDLGFLHDGALYLTGRVKDLIVQRGRNLHPEDFEAGIARCDPDVRPGRGVVFGVERDGDEAVVVGQEIRGGTSADRYPQIVARIRATLGAAHGVTADTVLLLPPGTVEKTSSGKPRRHAARRRFLSGELTHLYADDRRPPDRDRPDGHTEELAASLAAGTPLDRALALRLRSVLGLAEPPAPSASVTSLGLDSMGAASVQHELETALGIALEPSAVLRARSIADLTRVALAARPLAVVEANGSYQLNAAQRALWFLHRASPASAAYTVTRAFRVTGGVDRDRLAAALAAVLRDHPSLRLVVTSRDGEPHASVHTDTAVGIADLDARGWSPEAEAAWLRDVATTPFDLATGPLVRAALLRRADDHLLVLSLHHIACDAASLAVVVADLAARYAGAAVDRADPSVSPAALERHALEADGPRLAGYWSEVLGGELPVLSLPRTGSGTRGDGTALEFPVDPALTAALSDLARGSDLTLHSVLLAAYQVALHRLTGQPDVIIGVPVAGRRDPRTERWVGHLVNVLPIRSAWRPGTPWRAFTNSTHERMLDALDHQEFPLSHLVRLLNPTRDHAAAGIFSAMFAFYSTTLPGGAAARFVLGDPAAEVPLGDGRLHGCPTADHTAQSDLCLNVSMVDERLRCQLQYDPDRVTIEQAALVAETYPALLAALASQPGAATDAAPLLGPDAAAAQLADAAGPVVPRRAGYLDSFEDMVDRYPDRVAVDDGTVRLSYAELDARANVAAHRLRAAGVGPESSVLVSAPRSADYVAGVLAIHKADGCYVPVNPTEAPRRAADIARAIAPTAAIVSGRGAALLADLPTELTELTELIELTAGAGTVRPHRLGDPQAACTIIHTSGSTGVPKAAVSTTYGVTNHIWQMVEAFGLTGDDRVAQTAPISFDISVWQMLMPLTVGGRVRIVPEPESTSPARLLDAVTDGGVTMLELVPSNIIALLDAGLADRPNALRVMLSTGEPLTGEVVRRWVDAMPRVPMFNAYGPAECTDDVTAGLCAAGPDGPTTVAVGRPLANTSVYILDANLAPVPDGVVGSLYIGGGAVGRGYHGQPRRTAEAFVPDPYAAGGRLYRTGDLARRTADGDIEFLGRADTQLKIRGQRIETGEVEAAMRDCPGVLAAAVAARHGPAGVSLVGYLVTDAPDLPAEPQVLDVADGQRLRAALAERLPRHMIPTILVRLARLPRTANGKVDHKALRFDPPASTGTADGGPLDDPLTGAVRGIWAHLLGRDSIGDQDSFFALGGHSLLALTMVDRVGQVIRARLDIDTVFGRPRLADFVTAVRAADPVPPRPPVRAPEPVRPGRPVPASAAQHRFWYLREADPGRPTYNMPGMLRLTGDLSEEALEAALRDVLARHPVLLATFSAADGELTWTPGDPAGFVLPRIDLRGPIAEFGDGVIDRIVNEEAGRTIDIRHEPALRALLAHVGPKEWALVVVMDHIACDGWSLSVFLADLAACYNARATGEHPRLPAAGHSFADYCRDERRRPPADVAALWGDLPAGPVARSPLPRTTSARPGAGRHTRFLDEDLTAAVRAVAGSTGTTPYLVFAGALAALTHTGAPATQTVRFGMVIAQRDRPEWARVVGPLLNVSVLAVGLHDGATADQALRATRDGALRAYRSSHVPYQDLVRRFDRAAPRDDPFDVVVVMQPPTEPVEFDGLVAEQSDLDTDAAPYPLTVDIEAVGRGYRVSYRYDTAHYAGGDVERLADRLEHALRKLTADRSVTVAELRGGR
jgi:amino acid adenylation domain-containing protein